MTDRTDLEFDRLVDDWLRTEAPPRAPQWVLTSAVERVAVVGQQRTLGLPVLGWPGISAGWRWVIIGIALAVLALGGVAGAGADLFRQAAIAPPGVDDGWVAFTVGGRTRQSESDIFLVRDGLEEHRLTGSAVDAGREACPGFSPDGTRLVYTDGPPQALASPGVSVVIVSFDPSGQQVGPAVRVAVPSWGGVCPTWSPDGRSVAFLAFEPTTPEPVLWIADVDGTARRVGPWGEIDTVGSIDWSPDGTAVAASTDITGSRIWIVPIDGRKARLFQGAGPDTGLTSGPRLEGVRWSPDGTRLAAVVHADHGGADTPTTEDGPSIRIFDVSGSEEPVELEGGELFAWSPDGRQVAYVRAVERSGPQDWEIVVATLVDGEESVVADDHRLIRGLTWAPDGMRLLYVADADVSGQLMVVSAAGDSEPVALTEDGHLLEWTGSDEISWQAVVR